jgi:hypothetical protein
VLGQANDGAVAAGDAVDGLDGPTIGEKLRGAPGTKAGHIDVGFLQAGFKELVATDGPEIKVLGSDLVGVHPFGQFIAKVNELAAAGTE